MLLIFPFIIIIIQLASSSSTTRIQQQQVRHLHQERFEYIIEKMSNKLLAVIIILFGSTSWNDVVVVTGDPVEDKQALLDFLHNIPHSHSHTLNWNENSTVCNNNWRGVTCNADNSRIIALHLPGFGFYGPIPLNTLGRLTAIQTLSLRSNGISGSFPSDLYKLSNLSMLYLQYNKFTGELPLNFSVWGNLTAVDLSNNGFDGTIPCSISNLTHLTTLNLANNSLSGEIPPCFQRFPSSAFYGNNFSSSNGNAAKPSTKKKTLNETAILGITIGGSLVLFLLIALVMLLRYSNKKLGDDNPTDSQYKQGNSEKKVLESQDKKNRLMFFEDCSFTFDLEDLLRASAQVLGKGTFGTTYKAALEDGSMVVVKRLKEVSLSKKDFEQQMELVGNIRHDNVAALRAFYYSKDEKLIVHDYYDHGSVSALLHGNRGDKQISLDWESRVKIAVGTARGIHEIHTKNSSKLVHANIKASNVFINPQGFGCISDIGLATIMSPVPTPPTRAGGYRAPEISDARKSTHASDVYSFGVLLLELLTGKSPIHVTSGGGDEPVVNLVRWVNSIVKEEWTAEVFDIELLRYSNIEEEMVEMLKIGMACVVRMPDQRPQMSHVLKMVEGIRPAEMQDPGSQ